MDRAGIRRCCDAKFLRGLAWSVRNCQLMPVSFCYEILLNCIVQSFVIEKQFYQFSKCTSMFITQSVVHFLKFWIVVANSKLAFTPSDTFVFRFVVISKKQKKWKLFIYKPFPIFLSIRLSKMILRKTFVSVLTSHFLLLCSSSRLC